MICEWTRNGPMGCLIKPEVIPVGCCEWYDREVSCVSKFFDGQAPPPCCIPKSAGRVALISKYPRSVPSLLQWPPKPPNPKCWCKSEYKRTISHTGRVIQKYNLHNHTTCKSKCEHRIMKSVLHPCPLEYHCKKFIKL